MAVKINFNAEATKTHTALIYNERLMGKSLLRLSTGYRILNAADDSAGLFIADMLGTVAAALEQGNANIQTGISALQIAESSAGQIYTKLQEIYVRAQRAANDINDPNARAALQQEINNFIDAIQKIGTDTEYNGIKLLDGTFTNKYIHYGPRSEQVVYVSIADVRAQSLGGYMIKAPGTVDSVTGDVTFLTKIVSTSSQTVTVGGQSITATYQHDSNYVVDLGKIASDINNNTVLNQKGITAKAVNESIADADYTALASGDVTDLTVNFYVGDKKFSFTANPDISLDELINKINSEASNAGADLRASRVGNRLSLVSSQGHTILIEVNVTGSGEITVNLNQLLQDAESQTFTIDGSGTASAGKTGKLYIIGPEDFDIGMSSITDALGGESFDIGGAEDAKFQGLYDISVLTNDKAEIALLIVDAALKKVDKIRAQIGAIMNNLQSIFDSQKVAYDNTKEAESVIRNTDYAKEMSEFVTYQIRMQATVAMLAQANTLPQLVLQLMR